MSIIPSLAKANKRLEQSIEDPEISETNSSQTDSTTQVKTTIPPQQSSGLGALDYEAAVQSISSFSEKRGKYQKHSETDRFGIGKYATENGNSKCLVHF